VTTARASSDEDVPPIGGVLTSRSIETGTDHFMAEVSDGVAVLTMSRPERRNALSTEMGQGLQRALAECETATDVRCVVLTGAGGAFCAGGDVKGFAEGAAVSATRTFDQQVHAQRLDQRASSGVLYQMPKPTVAVLPGPAAGAGLSLALACDLRVAVEGAVLTTAFAKVGFSGVVNRVFAKNDFEDGWRALAAQLAAGPTIAYRYIKDNINRAVDGDLVECMDQEVTYHLHCGRTENHLEASKAFVEKRPPVFHGH
jgi:2-(1,2-epoxy-1,2-dihydrophenyl)acetyl-CoA isomerase